jgi:hypothetical protein
MTGSFSPNELTVLHRIVELAAADLGIIDEKEKSPNRSASNRRRRAGPMGFRDPHVPRERRHFARLPPSRSRTPCEGGQYRPIRRQKETRAMGA